MNSFTYIQCNNEKESIFIQKYFLKKNYQWQAGQKYVIEFDKYPFYFNINNIDKNISYSKTIPSTIIIESIKHYIRKEKLKRIT